jgi:hypothetical protein
MRRLLLLAAGLTALGATVVSWVHAPTATAAVLAAVTVFGGRPGGRQARRYWTYIWPTEAAIREAVGEAQVRLRVRGQIAHTPARQPSPAEVAVRARYGQYVEPVIRWLPDRIQRAVWTVAGPVDAKLDVFRRPDPARMRLTVRANHLSTEQQVNIAAIVRDKLPLGELQANWRFIGRRSTCTWRVRRRPPTHVGLADLNAAFPQLADWEYFLGLDDRGKPVTISLEDDSPHVCCSAGSGAGKSVLAQALAVQVLHRGGQVVILDRKGSHRWARGVPGVEYCTQPDEMHRALLRLAEMADARNLEAFEREDGYDVGPRFLVIAEELNATFGELRDHWADIREPGQPAVSPAVKAFRRLLFMGRSAKVHVFAVAQMLTANTAGGPEARENFGVRCLARYTRNNWQMLVPEAAMPRSSRTRGRWQVVVSGTARETQVVYLTAAQARAFAYLPENAHGPERPQAGFSPGTGDMADPRDELVTLREAIDEGILPWRHEAAKKRYQRARAAGEAPQTKAKRKNADLFRRGDLMAWSASEQGVLREEVKA